MQAIVIHIAGFSGIVLIQDPIQVCNSLVDYKSPADYTSFMKQKVAVEVMIGFAICENTPRGVTSQSEGLGFVVLTTPIFKVQSP